MHYKRRRAAVSPLPTSARPVLALGEQTDRSRHGAFRLKHGIRVQNSGVCTGRMGFAGLWVRFGSVAMHCRWRYL